MKNLRELVQEFALRMRLECAIVDELDKHSQELYKLKEYRKLDHAGFMTLQKEVQTLRLMVQRQGQNNAQP